MYVGYVCVRTVRINFQLRIEGVYGGRQPQFLFRAKECQGVATGLVCAFASWCNVLSLFHMGSKNLTS